MRMRGFRLRGNRTAPFFGQSYDHLAQGPRPMNLEVVSNLKILKKGSDEWDREVSVPRGYDETGLQGVCEIDIPRMAQVNCQVVLFAGDLVCVLDSSHRCPTEDVCGCERGEKKEKGMFVRGGPSWNAD